MADPEVINLDMSSDSDDARSSPTHENQYLHRFLVYLDTKRKLTKLRLLDDFVQKFCNDFEETCVLQTPNSKMFTVRLLKYGIRFFLTDGWGAFCRGYGLELGDSVVFQYIGSARFDVIVFGFSANEIDYHFDHSASTPTIPVPPTSAGHDNAIVFPSKRTRRFLDRTSKRVPMTTPIHGNINPNDHSHSKAFPRKTKNAGVSKTRNIVAASRQCLAKRKQSEEIDRTLESSSTYTPFFKTTLTEACLRKNGQLWIPKTHCTGYVKDFTDNFVTLQSDHHMFHVTLCRGEKSARFGRGWFGFAKACGFVAGHQCVFELTDVLSQTYSVRRL